jgi:hypothetical protein
MLYFIGKAQTNFISILFFTLNIANAMVLAKDDNKESTIKYSLICSKLLMYSSMIVIIVEFIFALIFGLEESKYPDSVDQ